MLGLLIPAAPVESGGAVVEGVVAGAVGTVTLVEGVETVTTVLDTGGTLTVTLVDTAGGTITVTLLVTTVGTV